MKNPKLIATALLAAAFTLAAGCAASETGSSVAQPAAAPVNGKVTDMTAFDAFIATRPTPAQFRGRYPDVTLVLPGQIATKELRLDNSRYFAELDSESRIKGGRFQ